MFYEFSDPNDVLMRCPWCETLMPYKPADRDEENPEYGAIICGACQYEAERAYLDAP